MPYIVALQNCPVKLILKDSFISPNEPDWPTHPAMYGESMDGNEIIIMTEKILFVEKMTDAKVAELLEKQKEPDDSKSGHGAKIIRPRFGIPRG